MLAGLPGGAGTTLKATGRYLRDETIGSVGDKLYHFTRRQLAGHRFEGEFGTTSASFRGTDRDKIKRPCGNTTRIDGTDCVERIPRGGGVLSCDRNCLSYYDINW
jgi:hypothetical protein